MTDPVFVRSEMTAVEKANAELVISYFDLWEGDFDPASAFASYFTPDARLRYEAGAQSPIKWDMGRWHIGCDEIVAANKLYADMGCTAKALIHDVYACGPLVVVHRTDLFTMPGSADRAVRLMGVFMIINGKIVEWSDYYGNRTSTGEGTD